jgi:hypothetical protein
MSMVEGNTLAAPAVFSSLQQLTWTAGPTLPDFATIGRYPGHTSPDRNKFVLRPKQTEVLYQSIPQSTGFEESIYNSLVSLKVAVSQFAMHLSSDERRRVFQELDSVINVDDWHEGDQLPKVTAFQDFLKWMIYSKYFKWISIGVSGDGGLLVAWKTKRVLLTAKFSGMGGQDAVRWTAKIQSDAGEVGHTAGKCPLRLFSEQAMFYLHGARSHAGE